MSKTSSKNSFGTQFKAHIAANRAAHHLRLKKFGNNKNLKKIVQGILTKGIMFQNGCVSMCHYVRSGRVRWFRSVRDDRPPTM
jgi:hypothetical protein